MGSGPGTGGRGGGGGGAGGLATLPFLEQEMAAAAEEAPPEEAAAPEEAPTPAEAPPEEAAAPEEAPTPAEAPPEEAAAPEEVPPEVAAAAEAVPADPYAMDFVSELGGSTGAVLVRDPATGKLCVRKKGDSADHLREEAYADDLYRAMGVDVPISHVYETAKGPVKLGEFLQGTALGKLTGEARANAEAQVRKNFVADALLGNWDVIGLASDNILVTPAGQVMRIDNGGSLRYRAMGLKKAASSWTGSVGEINSMRDPVKTSGRVFGKLTDAEVKQQIGGILKQSDKILAAAPKELRPVLSERLADLAKRAASM